MAETLYVDGLKQLNKVLSVADKAAQKDFRAELKTVGGIVRQEAKSIAVANGLVSSGALVRGIKIGFKRGSVSIYETASRESHTVVKTRVRNAKGARGGSTWEATGTRIENFPYPIIYEFGGRSTGHRFSKTAKVNNRSAIGKSLASWGGAAAHSSTHLGPRAFMYPALERKSKEVLDAFDNVLTGLSNDFQKGTL